MSPVFDEAKYRALLEKLEVSEVNLLYIRNKNFDFRIDSEYFFKEHLALDSLLDCKRFDTLSNLSYKISDGTHFTPEYVSSGIPFLSAINVQKNILDLDRGYQFITLQEHSNLYKRCDPKSGDILLRKVGVGERLACVVPQMDFEFSIFVSVALVRPKTINPFFLSTFINSCYGQKQLLRFNKGIGQPDLHLEDIARLRVIIPSVEFQAAIEKICKQGTNCFTNSKNIYADAEQLLLQELGLTDWQPDDESVATKTFADFQNSGRLDAEYYQPKYEAITEKLTQYNKGTVSCANVLVNAMTKLTADTEYCYLELADIGKSGEINSCTLDVAENLPSRARQKVKTNDVIVSSVEGSLTSCALITEEYNNAICSTGFHVLRSAEINSETLLLLMKSSPVQALLKQGCSGTILTAILPDALKAIKLPLIRKEVQTELAAKVQESFALRKESKRLLDLAKHAVEVAIEQGEDAAMKLLEEVK